MGPLETKMVVMSSEFLGHVLILIYKFDILFIQIHILYLGVDSSTQVISNIILLLHLLSLNRKITKTF